MKDFSGLIYSDYRRYCASGGDENWNPLSIIFFNQGLWASTCYRLAYGVWKIKNRSLRVPLRMFILILQKIIEIITNISIPPTTEIGAGLYFSHFGPTIINSEVKIGLNCNFSQGVTVGVVRGGGRAGVPTIGNRVYIGPNAILIGNITIGDDAAIGAGAVVVESVPPRGVVVGNPARVISINGSFEYIHYDDMEADPDRRASLLARQESSQDLS